jgi:tartrate dehydratase beta subunit/fumarate hydratase class I family protein
LRAYYQPPMDRYTVPLLELGLRAMIGKGERSEEIRQAIIRYRQYIW